MFDQNIEIPTELGIPTLFSVSEEEIQEELAQMQTSFGVNVDSENLENEIWG